MAAIFPPQDKGGVPPGVSVVNGFTPTHPVTGEGPLFVSPDCSTILTDGQLNAITSEILAAVDELGFAYNSTRIDNLGQSLSARFNQVESDIDGKVDRSGDVMSGPLMLVGNPASNDEAANKAYVDGQTSALDSSLRTYIDDETMAILQQAQILVANLDANKVDRSGDQMTGLLTLSGDPINPSHAATKQYVDDHAGGGVVGIPEAPAGGGIYARRQGGWVCAVAVDSAQALTPVQQTTARQNIYAAPIDALAFSGIQINGNMDVSLEHGVAAITAPSTYAIDGWIVSSVGSQTFSAVQIADGPPGYSHSLQITVTAPNAGPAANDDLSFVHRIEGLRFAKLAFGTAAASYVSILFWVKANRTGLYSGVLRNGSNARSCTFMFAVNVSATWELKMVTLPGDTTGTWSNDATLGATFRISMMTGSALQTSAGGWKEGTYNGVPGSINGAAATTDVMRLTGVLIVPGIELPGSDRAAFVMRAADEESEWCRRYWNITRVINRFLAANYQADSDVQGFFSRSFRNTPNLTLIPGQRLNVYSAQADGGFLEGHFRHTMLAGGPGDSYCYNDTVTGDARL